MITLYDLIKHISINIPCEQWFLSLRSVSSALEKPLLAGYHQYGYSLEIYKRVCTVLMCEHDTLILMTLFVIMLEVLVSSVYSVDQDKSWFATLKAIRERFLTGLLKSNKWLKFTLKVAETFVKFAIPPPMIRIFPVNKTQSHKEW